MEIEVSSIFNKNILSYPCENWQQPVKKRCILVRLILLSGPVSNLVQTQCGCWKESYGSHYNRPRMPKRGRFSHPIFSLLFGDMELILFYFCQDKVKYSHNGGGGYKYEEYSRAGRSNPIALYLWDVIICPCPWYLLLANKTSVDVNVKYIGNTCRSQTDSTLCLTYVLKLEKVTTNYRIHTKSP